MLQACAAGNHVFSSGRPARLPLRLLRTRLLISTVAVTTSESCAQVRRKFMRSRLVQLQAQEPSADSVQETELEEQETVFYEGSGSNAELAISLLLGFTLLYLPLTLASVGRRVWINWKFTNKRIIVENTSPLFKRTVQVPISEVNEVRTAPRAFGAWGDMVIFLKDGARLELVGLERYKDIQMYVEGLIT